MIWLLVTSSHNPGDAFARFGIERLIREIDEHARFILLDKEDPQAWEDDWGFDRAVLCGMPIAWSHPGQTCNEIWWWEKLFNGWVTKDPKKFIAIGVGSVVGRNGVHNEEKYLAAINELIEKSFAVTVRNHIVADDRLIESVCPSLFALEPDPELKEGRLLCNLMRQGAHDPLFDVDESVLWGQHLHDVTQGLIHDFTFVAHCADEVRLAAELGFKDIEMYFDHREYLKLYGQCREYVGNRLHGAMVAAAAGARVCAVGYDSRVKMLEKVGVQPQLPSEYLRKPRWSSISQDGRALIQAERERTKELLLNFKNQNDLP